MLCHLPWFMAYEQIIKAPRLLVTAVCTYLYCKIIYFFGASHLLSMGGESIRFPWAET
jgi:hypothetical protein